MRRLYVFGKKMSLMPKEIDLDFSIRFVGRMRR